MRINLPDVTVVMVGDAEEKLADLALKRTLEQIKPGAIIRDETPIASPMDADAVLWRRCAEAGTSHVLAVQYDGWVTDSDMWVPEFLKYDYIGAPWPHRGLAVGNGGFSLRSTKLMRFLVENEDRFPVTTPEDSAICLDYRAALEKEGFLFAPARLAHQFSFERCPKRRSFGFHCVANVHKVLPAAECDAWMALATDYVKGKPEWQELLAARA